MARSFARPGADAAAEDFSRARGAHAPSQRQYALALEGEDYLFRRYQTDDDGGDEINVFEQKVDWILGSGNKTRSYLYQTESGELFQLPIAYYTDEKMWYMAPGYDRKDHEGVGRHVTRECLFCHSDYPEYAQDSDAYGAPDVFPTNLPQGIGCARCHGPGEAHVEAATSDAANVEKVRAAIVNPARLDARRRDDVCYQCHMQPSVDLFGVRRFGRGDYSFRPGEALSDYQVEMDPVDANMPRPERFEINHHPYRLEQSKCFQQSEGALSCVSCHDPHRGVPEAERAAHYKAACEKCHEPETYSGVHAAASPAVESMDCVSCHMPQRRPQDVVHVVMTDHFIRREPGGPELVAPLQEKEPRLEDVELTRPETVDPGERPLYRAVAVSRAVGGAYKPAMARLELILGQLNPMHVEPYLDLIKGYLRQKQFAEAAQTARLVLDRDPENIQARAWLGLSLLGQQELDAAEEEFQKVLKITPQGPEVNYNYALLLIGKDRYADAVEHLETAVRARHNMAPAWYYLGYCHGKLDQLNEAFLSYRKALQIEPTHTRAYVGIGKTLVAQGNRDEALRYLQHGLKAAAQIAPIAQELDRIKAGAQ
jgi:Tfp pilus assembly protein PilF